MKFAIDIGHGKHNRKRGVNDPGMLAIGPGDEHSKAEGMGRRIRLDLLALGHKVLFIEDMPLSDRDDYAHAWGSDFLLSLHFNAGGGSGPEVYTDRWPSYRSRRVADEVSMRIARVLGLKNRGRKSTGGLAVLSKNKSDCLVEIVFGDNKNDMAKFHSDIDGVELAILNGLLVGCGLPSVSKLPRLKG